MANLIPLQEAELHTEIVLGYRNKCIVIIVNNYYKITITNYYNYYKNYYKIHIKLNITKPITVMNKCG